MLVRYQAALVQPGDPARGRQVFERVCAKCHRLAGLGREVGPDLATIQNRPPQLSAAGHPHPGPLDRPGHEAYVVHTKSGLIIEGVMGTQTPTTLTIRH